MLETPFDVSRLTLESIIRISSNKNLLGKSAMLAFVETLTCHGLNPNYKHNWPSTESILDDAAEFDKTLGAPLCVAAA